ncbi:class I ribonucleotide reductase maintenance protein YfaE [Fastidiosibacter lacustris]|uniref:class I ribonucleotide reductase maintenance protein YfaE n=1 Tax=Fastidiosibacter lacustris TaxID=2056695 RepID=UPI000E3485F4|nr:class I ribonucleotide reductase maintenance protein YfaE [Fastidiosibacter lacustris]
MTVIKYNKHVIETTSKDKSILEILEQNQISPNFQCRNGICGTCRCKLIKGHIHYLKMPLAFTKENEILICIANAHHFIELET